MPQDSFALSAFMRRDGFEKMMFGYVHGMRRGMMTALPGVTEEKVIDHVSVQTALRAFAKEFDLPPHIFNVRNHEIIYGRMVKEWHEEQRTKAKEPA